MSSPPTEEDHIAVPRIRIQSASPKRPEDPLEEAQAPITPRPAPTRLRTRTLQVPNNPSRKRSASDAELSDSYSDSDSDTEPESKKIMSSRSSKKDKEPARPPPKSRSKSTKTDDWTEVTEPEERRRIQNRIAQRKFREKARENKERAERESRNQENAGSTYHIPTATDLAADHEASGLPWGGMSWGHVVSRGHEEESRRSSGRGEYVREDSRYLNPYTNSGDAYQQSGGYRVPPSHTGGGSSGGEDPYESPYYYPEYDQSGQPTHQQQDFFTSQYQYFEWPEAQQQECSLSPSSATLPYPDTPDLVI